MPSTARSTHRPSGVQLPLQLRKKWRDQQAAEVKADENQADVAGQSPDYSDLHTTPPIQDADKVFTAEELEDRFYRVSAAMIEVQKHLCRGEEIYHEETHNHGNLQTRWDAFVDARDVGLRDSSARESSGSGRRLPSDHRWFSNSCRSVTRSSRPTSFFALRKPAVPSRTGTPYSQVSHSSDTASASGGAVSSSQSIAGGGVARGSMSSPPPANVSVTVAPIQPSIPKPSTPNPEPNATPLTVEATLQSSSDISTTPSSSGRRASRKRKAGDSA